MSKVEILSPEGLRSDGRRPRELRKLAGRMGVFEQADGSAYIEMGNTKVLATVYGPHESKNRLHDRATINCELSMATFSTGERKQRSKGDRRAQEFEGILQQAFEAAVTTSIYPRSQIDIYVQVFQSDGGFQSACINAATLALIDAGIPMIDYVCACTVGCAENIPLLDLNYSENSSGSAEMLVAMLPTSEKSVALELDSRLHLDKFEPMLTLATQGCLEIYKKLNAIVIERNTALFARLG